MIKYAETTNKWQNSKYVTFLLVQVVQTGGKLVNMLSSSSIYVTNKREGAWLQGARQGQTGAALAHMLVRRGGAQPVRSRGVARPRTGAWRRRRCNRAAAPVEVACYLRRGARRWPRRKTSVALVAETREAFYTDTTLSIASNREERRAPMEKLAGKPHRKKKKSKGISHMMMDLREGEYHGVEDDEKNLVVVVLAGDAPGGQKELAGGVGRRW